MSERTWRTMMWTGVAAGALLLAVWTASMFHSLRWNSKLRFPQEPTPLRLHFGVSSGLCQFTNRLADFHEGWWGSSHKFSFNDVHWWPSSMYPLVDITKGALGSSLWNVSLNVPLWMPTALCGGLATWGGLAARKIKNRRERGLCLFCGYDRGGLAGPSTPCPECGNIVKP